MITPRTWMPPDWISCDIPSGWFGLTSRVVGVQNSSAEWHAQESNSCSIPGPTLSSKILKNMRNLRLTESLDSRRRGVALSRPLCWTAQNTAVLYGDA